MVISSPTQSFYQTGITSGLSPNVPLKQSGLKNITVSVPQGTPSSQPSAQQNPASGNVDPATSTGKQTQQTDASSTQQPADSQAGEKVINGHELSPQEMKLVQTLKRADSEVRQHEMAHIAAGGRYITSGANFTYRRGPDGKNYAVSGEVGIDTSPVPGDPEATIRKMRQIKNSALAPASPSPQDLKVAANATSLASKASSELMVLHAKQQTSEGKETATGNMTKAANTYESVGSLPETETSSFKIAV